MPIRRCRVGRRAREPKTEDPLGDGPSFVSFIRNLVPFDHAAVTKATFTENELIRLRSWRDALYAVLAGHAAGKVPQGALAVLNEGIARAAQQMRVSSELKVELISHDRLIERIVAICVDELARCDPGRIKRCRRPECNLLFYDPTRNRNARWHAENPCGWRARDARRRRSVVA